MLNIIFWGWNQLMGLRSTLRFEWRGLTSIIKDKSIKVKGIRRWVGVKHIKRLNTESKDQLIYRQKDFVPWV